MIRSSADLDQGRAEAPVPNQQVDGLGKHYDFIAVFGNFRGKRHDKLIAAKAASYITIYSVFRFSIGQDGAPRVVAWG
jgi:hypothetical protein